MALHRALRNIRKDKYDMLQLMVDQVADVNMQDTRGAERPCRSHEEKGKVRSGGQKSREHGARKVALSVARIVGRGRESVPSSYVCL